MSDRRLIQIEEYLSNNDTERASSLLLEHETEYKINAEYWNLKGIMNFQKGKIERAISCFVQALDLAPDYKDAIINMNYVKSQLLDASMLGKEALLQKILGILDRIIIDVRECIEKLDLNNISYSIDTFKSVQGRLEPYYREQYNIKEFVQSRFVLNLFENIMICIEDCIEDCLNNNGAQLVRLVEFTLYSLLKEFREEVYFFGLIYPDTNKMQNYYKSEFAAANANEYARRSLQTGKYKYEVSIVVTAFNKVEYTKQCVESILKYTANLNYELILVNDGSIDGTQEYFDNLQYKNKKTIHLKKNTGAMLAYFIGVRAVEGRVLAAVSNDVIVTKDWLQNLLICVNSDERIGMVVPTTNVISNNQAIPVPYTEVEDMQEFASNYNISNPDKWFERERLCPFLHVVPMHIYGKGICHDRLFYYGEFCDDDISLQLRLNGYKLILAKDTFCHHYGSVSLGEDQRKNASLTISRELFKQKNSVDAWDGSRYELFHLVSDVVLEQDKSCKILFVDPGFGLLPYWIRNKAQEKKVDSVTCYQFTADEQFISISDKLFTNFCSAADTGDLLTTYEGEKFDHVIFCRAYEEYEDGERILANIRGILALNGEVRFFINNQFSAHHILNLLSLQDIPVNDQFITKFMSHDYVEKLLSNAGFQSIRKTGITAHNNYNQVDIIKKFATYLKLELSMKHDVMYGSSQLVYIVH